MVTSKPANERAELSAKPLNVIRDASDIRGGSWILQYAMATRNAKSLPDISVAAKELAKSLSWEKLDEKRDVIIMQIANASGYDAADQDRLKSILRVATDLYARKRETTDFWNVGEEKQVLNDVARALGFAGASGLLPAAFAVWARGDFNVPEEINPFRDYLAGLRE